MARLIVEGSESTPAEKRARIRYYEQVCRVKRDRVDESPLFQDDYEDEDEMPLDVFKEYSRQLEESEYFEVDDFRKYFMFNMVVPLKLDAYYTNAVTPLAKEALNMFNQEKKTSFEFVRIQNLTGQVLSGMDYFITFEAIDTAAEPEGQPITFQSQARTWAARNMKDEILFCRIKPTKSNGTENEQVVKGLTSS